MFPPESTATGRRAAGSSSRPEQAGGHGGRAARLGHEMRLGRQAAHRGENLRVADGDDGRHVFPHVREGQFADSLHPQCVGDRALDRRGRRGDPLSFAERVPGVRGELGLDSHDGDVRADRAGGGRDARDQAAAAHRDDDQVRIRLVGHDLQANGALAGDDAAVVERRDERVTVPGHQIVGGGLAGRHGRRHPHQFRAAGGDGAGFADGRILRHHHHGTRAQQGRGVGHRVPMITARMGDHPALPVRGRQRTDGRVGAAELERADRLQRFGFDQ